MARYLCSGPGHAAQLKKKALTEPIKPSLDNLSLWLNAEFGQQAVAIALIDGPQIRYHLHGLADVANAAPVTQHTLFEIGSVSKPLTALAILSQIARGRWQLTQSIAEQTNLPALATHTYTLAELLTHRSGLPRLPANMSLTDLSNPYAIYDDTLLQAALANTEFPEEGFSYSNFGYGLLGWLLQQDLQQSYAEVMQQQVFQPLGMQHAAVQMPGYKPVTPLQDGLTTDNNLNKLATGYAISGDAVEHWQFDSLAGAGAVVATIEDMATMLTTLFQQTPHSALLQQWLTPLPTTGEPRMTPGWMLSQQDWLWHAGQTAGFCSLVVFDPKQQKGIVILTNIAVPVTTQGFTLFEQWLAQDKQTK